MFELTFYQTANISRQYVINTGYYNIWNTVESQNNSKDLINLMSIEPCITYLILKTIKYLLEHRITIIIFIQSSMSMIPIVTRVTCVV